MLVLYLACLALGGALVLLSLGAADALDFGDGEWSHDVGDMGAGEGWLHAFAGFVSLRGAVFFVAFFGLTGSALTLLRLSGALTFASAVGMGMLAGSLLQRAVRYLQRTESGTPPELSDLEGQPAAVLVDCARPGRGKIAVALEDHTVQLLARVADEAGRDAFRAGERVVVVRIRDGVAEISEEDILR